MLQMALQKFQDYWANSWHIFLFILALIYILIWVKDKKTKKTFWWYSALFAVVFLCPLTIKLITTFIGDLVYWRMFWLLPTSIIMAFAFTHLYETIKAKWLKVVALLVMTAMVAFGGAFMYTNINFTVATNWYKVSPAIPGICEAIQADAEEQELQPRAVVVNSLLAEIRQYDAGIKLLYGRNGERGSISKEKKRVYKQMQKEIPNYTKLKKLLIKQESNYLVWTGSEDSFAGFEENGFRLVGEVERYKVYFVE